jgi:hypothetical protein
VGRVADNSLIEIPDLDLDLSSSICQRSYVADMAVSANSNRRTLGNDFALTVYQPFVEMPSIASDITVCRGSHSKLDGDLRGLVPGCLRRCFSVKLPCCNC